MIHVSQILIVIFSLISDLDFSNMTLHQAKRGEMESQVRVLELESELEKERQRLSELRRQHYKMAAESEDVDAEVSDVTTSHERSFIVVIKMSATYTAHVF